MGVEKGIGRTQSVCPVCLGPVAGKKVARPEGIFLEKTCPDHGEFSVLIWEGDEASYLAWDRANPERDEMPLARPVDKGCPYDCGLCQAHERLTCCVLLEVTARCNLSCPICFADAGQEKPDPSLSEIGAWYDRLNVQGGGYNIQLSGGEPTMREDLAEVISLGREKGFTFFQLNTNGLRLAREEGYARKLKEAGLDTVFLQFDGVTGEVYEKTRGRDILQEKYAAIAACGEAGLGVVLVPTLVAGVNDREVGSILDFAMANMPVVRGVHFQPISYFGRYEDQPPVWRMTIPYLLKEIQDQTKGRMQAKDFVGGGAENAYCSFHADYLLNEDGHLQARGRAQEETSCCSCSCGLTSKQSQEVVANRWRLYRPEEGAEDGFSQWLADRQNATFTVSAMFFQDAWTFEVDRVKRCYIHEVADADNLVPFCAFNLTSQSGQSLYRGSGSCRA